MEIHITVASKPKDHMFSDQGASMAYVLNGLSGGRLVLQWESEYKLQINAPSHPWYMTLSEKGAPQKEEDDRAISNLKPIEIGELTFRPSDSITDSSIIQALKKDGTAYAFYQCHRHPYMGGPLEIHATTINW